MAKGLADRYEGSNVSLSLPSTRVDAFNITLANEFSRNGRRSGLTFAPEGGSERMRKVINKMVTEEDLIRTVATAYGNGWRQVKLYFMCGLPTETDEDVLAIADLAKEVIAKGREVSGRNDIRCTVSIGGFVPKPHTPFQWAAQLDHETTDERLRKLREVVRADKRYGRAIGFRYHDGKPGTIEGLLSRGDRRVGAVIEQVWRDGGRFDGWSEHFSYERWLSACEQALVGVDLDWYTTRERDYDEVLPWEHLDSGLDKDWLWADWEDALAVADGSADVEVEDCRWTPVLRLRRLPGDGHRDPDRPHRPAAAPAQRRRSSRSAGPDPALEPGAVGREPEAGQRVPGRRRSRVVGDAGDQQPLVVDRHVGLAVQRVQADQVRHHGAVRRGLVLVQLHQHQHLGVVRVVAVGAGQVGQGGLLALEERRRVHAVAAVEVRHGRQVGVLAQHDDHGDGHGGQGHRDRRQDGASHAAQLRACGGQVRPVGVVGHARGVCHPPPGPARSARCR